MIVPRGLALVIFALVVFLGCLVAGPFGLADRVATGPDATAAATPPADDAPPAPPSASSATAATFSPTSSKFVGSRSCAATACHGSPQPDAEPTRRIARNEYIAWSERDPHARSYEAVAGPKGRKMLELLGVKLDGNEIQDARYQNCLVCHDPTPPPARRGPNFTLHEGVGCEACHGAASHWESEHYRAGYSRERAWSLGQKETRSAPVRASVCTPCHVGGAQADVSHDLIAAGHPALKFELAAYCDLLPKHWNETRERSRRRDLELELWLAGQFTAAHSALELTVRRAGAAGTTAEAVPPQTANGPSAWPEFAEYDCFACHHNLAAPSWRQARSAADPPRRPGQLPASNWYRSMSAALAQVRPDSSLAKFADGQGQLAASLQRNAPSPAAVRSQAALAALPLQDLLNSQLTLSFEFKDARKEVKQVLAQIAARAEKAGWSDWESATQAYLALAAYERSLLDDALHGHPLAPDLRARLRRLLADFRAELVFPTGSLGPLPFEKSAGDEAGAARLASLGKKFAEIVGQLP